MTIRSAKELLHLQLTEPANGPDKLAGRLIDYICDQALLAAADSYPSTGVSRKFSTTFDSLLSSALEYLDRVNPIGATYFRAGIHQLVENNTCTNS